MFRLFLRTSRASHTWLGVKMVYKMANLVMEAKLEWKQLTNCLQIIAKLKDIKSQQSRQDQFNFLLSREHSSGSALYGSSMNLHKVQ